MSAAPLTCQELVELVTEYFEGALPPGDRERFELHIARCGGCRAYLEQMRRSIALLGRLTEESIPTAAQAELLQLFRNWKAGR